MSSLAVRYRPIDFTDVCEQGSVVKMLNYMIETNTFPNCMMFTGAAGTGKTTSARIMASQINKGKGQPIEVDAASNNSVENVRVIIEDAKYKSLDSEYKVYIMDEVHALSSSAWQALLKLIEEPPAKTIFILCTTDPQKIPATIHSRVQRFNFNRITYEGIKKRLVHIIIEENKEGKGIKFNDGAISYIAKMADGGMRDAITLMEKCLSYSVDLTVETVVNALGVQDYNTMFTLLKHINDRNSAFCIELVEKAYFEGGDLKQFIKQFSSFLLDVCKFRLLGDFKFVDIPELYEAEIKVLMGKDFDRINVIRNRMVKLLNDVKWDSKPKVLFESALLDLCAGV